MKWCRQSHCKIEETPGSRSRDLADTCTSGEEMKLKEFNALPEIMTP